MCLWWALLDNGLCISYYSVLIVMTSINLAQSNRGDSKQLEFITLICHFLLLIIHCFIFACVESAHANIRKMIRKQAQTPQCVGGLYESVHTPRYLANENAFNCGSNIYDYIRRESSTRDNILEGPDYVIPLCTFSRSGGEEYSELKPRETYDKFPSQETEFYDPLKVLK